MIQGRFFIFINIYIVIEMDRLREINQEYDQWQKELSIREMKLRPSYFIEKDTDMLDAMIGMIGIKEKKLHRK